ncbi:MAG: nitrile hydratase subunit alpha [Betaproteobacteria bacterium RIFCSPLOWO2_02_64_14]|nr:MAG: nitrile hydratase subunit alpha [Betaproteobacteria bacterium RIFCSPLOWO2_02_64_14]
MSNPNFDYYARAKQEHGHDHNHDHDDHAPVNEHDNGPPSDYEIMSRAMQELLEEKGLITAEQVRRRMELFDEEFPYRGSRVIARAWTDPAFKARLLADGRAACAEMDIVLESERLIAVENTPDVHNVIVCTLCSCYPRALLGMPPTWYKSRNYRSRVVFEPRTVLHEFGTVLPDHVTVRVHDSNADMRYVVIPMRPEGTEGWSEEQLAEILTRDALVGVTVPRIGR